LRAGFNSIPRALARRRLGIPAEAKLIVSFGGSLGAEGINKAVLDLWEGYALQAEPVHHIHGAGRRYYKAFCEAVSRRFGALPGRIQYREYLEEVPLLMAACDLLICRSGAMTLSEAARAGRAAILIPSPHVVGDHQTKNAEALRALGAATVLRENALTAESITAAVAHILESPDIQEAMEKAASSFDIPDANRRIYNALFQLAHDRKKPTF
jgi:UDP-N-acetylglucosamine--N-acetylmuramyl-(pentapeptide) pyrophosphoryl-undecaprenol N-acetylglucosamine transferase